MFIEPSQLLCLLHSFPAHPTLSPLEERTRLIFWCYWRPAESPECAVQPPHIPLTFGRSQFSLKWSQQPLSSAQSVNGLRGRTLSVLTAPG